jgi:hypothetical protein
MRVDYLGMKVFLANLEITLVPFEFIRLHYFNITEGKK